MFAGATWRTSRGWGYRLIVTDDLKVKLYGSKSRHSINLPSDFVRDSAFPFKFGEELIARIEDGKVIIEKGQSTI